MHEPLYGREAGRPSSGLWEGPAPELSALARALGYEQLRWFPDEDRTGPRGSELSAARARRALDWSLLAALAPGEVRVLGTSERRRSARLAAGAGLEVAVRTPSVGFPGATPGGVLLLTASPDFALRDAAALTSLAGLAARVAEAEQRSRELERAGAERALGQRLAALTHDLRNQLTWVVLQVERLRAAPQDLSDAHDELDRLENGLCAARDLCADGLAGEPAHGAARTLMLRAILLSEARAAATVARGSAGVRVRVHCPTGLAVHGELHAVARLVRNLLLNAVEASCHGGEVHARARDTPRGRVELEVIDSGRGMPAGEVRQLFAPGGSRAGDGYGTTSLLHCLESLGAEVTVETAPGKGTRVRVDLPGVPDRDRPQVVIVDRDPRRRSQLVARLRASGLGAWEGASPGEALSLLRRVRAEGVVLARGLWGPRLDALTRQIERDRIPSWVTAAGEPPSPAEVWARIGGVGERPSPSAFACGPG